MKTEGRGRGKREERRGRREERRRKRRRKWEREEGRKKTLGRRRRESKKIGEEERSYLCFLERVFFFFFFVGANQQQIIQRLQCVVNGLSSKNERAVENYLLILLRIASDSTQERNPTLLMILFADGKQIFVCRRRIGRAGAQRTSWSSADMCQFGLQTCTSSLLPSCSWLLRSSFFFRLLEHDSALSSFGSARGFVA